MEDLAQEFYNVLTQSHTINPIVIDQEQAFISSDKKITQELEHACIPGSWLESYIDEFSSQGALMGFFLGHSHP